MEWGLNLLLPRLELTFPFPPASLFCLKVSTIIRKCLNLQFDATIGSSRENFSHATFGHLRRHQKRFDGVDVEIIVDGVRRQVSVVCLRTVEGIRTEAVAHFTVNGRRNGLRFWR